MTDHNSLPAIRHLVSKKQLEQALALVAKGAVKSVLPTGHGFDGVIYSDTSFPYIASFTVVSGQIYGQCSCLSNTPTQPLCEHVIALYLAANPDQEHLRVGDNRKLLPPPGETLAAARLRELQRRKERAQTDIAHVKKLTTENRGSREFSVISLSDKSYRVVLHSSDIYANDCDCPDLEINQLGTCKHIEAALLNQSGQEIKAAKPVLYCDYAKGLPILALLPATDESANKAELSALFEASAPHYLKELDSDTCHTINSFAANGVLVINSTARHFLASYQEKQAASSNANQVITDLQAGQHLAGFNSLLTAREQEALAFILSSPAALVTAPFGWGKTITSLAAIMALAKNNNNYKVLIVTTAPLVQDWVRSAENNISLPVSPFQLSSELPESGLLVASFENALRGSEELSSFKPDMLIVDEAQYINNWGSPTGNTLRLLNASRRLVLTSCDLLPEPDTLYSIMQIVDQHILGPLWLFNQRFVSFDDNGNPHFRSPEAILSHLSAHWWRRPMLQEENPPFCQLGHSFVALPEKNQETYTKVFSRLPALKKESLLPKPIYDLLDEANRSLYFTPASNLKHSQISPKVELLIQLWRGLFTKTERHYIIVAHDEQILNLATVCNNHLGMQGSIIYRDLTPSSLAAKLEAFYGTKGPALLFCSDATLGQIKSDRHHTFIFFDLPWHPQQLSERLRLVGHNPVITLIYQNSLEQSVLDFYERHFADYSSLPPPAENGDQIVNRDSPLAVLLQELLNSLVPDSSAPAEKKESKTARKKAKSNNSLLELFDEEEESQAQTDAVATQTEQSSTAEDILFDLRHLLEITDILAHTEHLKGHSPAELLRSAYNTHSSDRALLTFHQLAEMYTILSRGESAPQSLVTRLKAGLKKLGIEI